MAQTEEFLGTGRRKRAIARVRLADGSGKVTVNGHDVEDYFTVENQRSIAIEPLETVDLNEKTDVRVNVTGGGMAGQAGAVRLGIARALEKSNGELRQPLKDAGHLSRDPRKKRTKEAWTARGSEKVPIQQTLIIIISKPRRLKHWRGFCFFEITK